MRNRAIFYPYLILLTGYFMRAIVLDEGGTIAGAQAAQLPNIQALQA
jgi:hypothetical protein